VRIEIDRDLCIGFGNCVETAPGVFELDDEEIATVKDPEAADMNALRDAERLCPSAAITIVDED
jgi:ferredoxin